MYTALNGMVSIAHFPKVHMHNFLSCISIYRDSGESLFITQCAATETKKVIRQKPAARSRSVSGKKSKNETEKCTSEDFLKRWQCLGGFMITPKKRYTKPKRKGPRKRFRPIKACFPFLLKSQKQQHLTLQKHQVLEVWGCQYFCMSHAYVVILFI